MPSKGMKNIGVNICNLPEAHGFKQIIICIGFFSMFPIAKAIKDLRQRLQVVYIRKFAEMDASKIK